MARRRPADKPLSEPTMVRSLTHICITWPQWVKHFVGNGRQNQRLLTYHDIRYLCLAITFENQRCHVQNFKFHTYSIDSKTNTSTVTFQVRVGIGLLWNFMGWFSNACEMCWLYWLTILCKLLPLLTHELIRALILLYAICVDKWQPSVVECIMFCDQIVRLGVHICCTYFGSKYSNIWGISV